jgi:ribosomal protein S24E
MEILKNNENKLLKRKEIEARLDNLSATPSRIEVKKELAKKLKVDESLVIVNEIKHDYGDPKAYVKAKIYNSEKDLQVNARPHMIKRNTQEVAKEGQEEAQA